METKPATSMLQATVTTTAAITKAEPIAPAAIATIATATAPDGTTATPDTPTAMMVPEPVGMTATQATPTTTPEITVDGNQSIKPSTALHPPERGMGVTQRSNEANNKLPKISPPGGAMKNSNKYRDTIKTQSKRSTSDTQQLQKII